MTWVIIGGILLIFFCWLLFAPLFLYINTDEKTYSAGLKGLLNLSLISDEAEIFYLRISVVFYSFNFYPFKKKEKKSKALSKPKKPKKKKKSPEFKTIWLIIKIAWNIVRSFRFKKLYLNFDSTDIMTNASLIPVFVNLNRNNIDLNVNYHGDFEMIIRIENNIFRILVVTIQTFLHHKKVL